MLKWLGVASFALISISAFGDGRLAPATDAAYLQECGGCHLAYPPGLLPARSWNRLLAGLDDHFGENAELAAPARDHLRAYLTGNAADNATNKRSRRIVASLDGATPLRISETPYIQHKHRELPSGAIGANAKVKTLGDCAACHRQAQRGDFNDDDVVIPGIGRWQD
jgi:hypothetical protein